MEARSPNSDCRLEKLLHYFWEEKLHPPVLPVFLSPRFSSVVSWQQLSLNLFTCGSVGVFMLGWLLPPYSALPMQTEDDPSPAASSPLTMSSAPKVRPNTFQAPGKVLILVCASWELFQSFRKGVG